MDSAKNIEDKCEVLIKWLGRLDQEYGGPGTNPYAYQANAIYLYRDEDFVQVFGRPFDQTDTRWRAELHEKVIKRCQGFMPPPGPGPIHLGARRPLTAYANQLRPFTAVLDGPFAGQMGPFSPSAVNAAIEKAREARRSMDRTLAEIPSMPATPDSFKALAQHASGTPQAGIVRGRGMPAYPPSSALWPSEQKYLAEAAVKRRTEIATQVAARWVTEIDAFGPALEEARRLTQEQQQRAEIFAAVDGSLRAEAAAKYNAKLAAIVDPLVLERVEPLAAMPGTLAGVRQTLEWKAGFDRDFGAYPVASIAAARQKYAENRSRILNAALPEWGTVARGQNAGADPARVLADLFPERGSAFGNEYAQYRRTLFAAVLEVAASTPAVSAPIEKAADATVCDELAAHPQDPARKAQGVADGAIDIEKAIESCEAAVAKAPKVGRYYFQLGRAYWADDDFESAVEAFLKAEELQYEPAYFYLGEAYREGLVEDEEADPEFAKQLYQMAAAAGFSPAVAAYTGGKAPQASAQGAYEAFKRPEWILSLLVNDASAFSQDRFHALSYLLGMQDWLNVEDHELDPVCPQKTNASLGGRIESQIAQVAPRPEFERAMLNLAQSFGAKPEDGAEKTDPAFYQMGVDDISVIVADFGGCSGAAFDKAYKTLIAAAR